MTSVRKCVYALLTKLPIKYKVIINLNVFIYVINIITIRNLIKKGNVYPIGTTGAPRGWPRLLRLTVNPHTLMWKWEEIGPNKEYGLVSLSVTIYSELIIKIDIKSYFDSIDISSELPSIRNKDC